MPKMYYSIVMKRLLAGLALAGISASWSFGQGLADGPGINEALAAIRSQAHAFKPAPRPALRHKNRGAHRMGHPGKALYAGPAETPNISPYTIRGLDVSHHDNAISWGQVKAQGFSFVFIKATEADDFVDPNFPTYWQGAADAGLAEGAYHFYDFCEAGAAQADNFIKTVPRTAGALPMVIDLEESSDCGTWPAKPAFLKELAAFVTKVKEAYGLTPILYINLGIYNRYLSDGAGVGYKLWIADPRHVAPQMPAGENWAFWQYAWHGEVSGIGSEVDLDVFSGDAKALSALAQP